MRAEYNIRASYGFRNTKPLKWITNDRDIFAPQFKTCVSMPNYSNQKTSSNSDTLVMTYKSSRDASVIIVGRWLPRSGVDDMLLARDVTMAMEHIIISANYEGFGTCWIGASGARATNPICKRIR